MENEFDNGAPLKLALQIPAVEVVDMPQSAWDDILSMHNEKELVEKQIVLPLSHPELARKHGTSIPKGILLFGPPGTGKTVFAKGTAGKLGWKFVEISPSALGATSRKEAFELKIIFDNIKRLNRIVVFFDEFEELVMRPEHATKEERVLSNEFLKQLPKIRSNNNIVLICATNNIRMLNPALLRPGRFDLILPVGSLDKISRKTIFTHKTENLMKEELDFDLLAENTGGFTPADIEAVVSQVSHRSFEMEISSEQEYRLTTEDFLSAIRSHHPTISKEEMETFNEDAVKYCRADYCHVF